MAESRTQEEDVDEFDHLMETAWSQELEENLAAKNDGQVAYVAKAASKVTTEVEESKTTAVTDKSTAKLDNEEESNQLVEQFGDELMNRMMQEGTQEESHYVKEYNEVVAHISQICNHIMANQKLPAGQEAKPIDEHEVVELCPRISTLASEYRNLTD